MAAGVSIGGQARSTSSSALRRRLADIHHHRHHDRSAFRVFGGRHGLTEVLRRGHPAGSAGARADAGDLFDRTAADPAVER